jgi:hypothetical protein
MSFGESFVLNVRKKSLSLRRYLKKTNYEFFPGIGKRAVLGARIQVGSRRSGKAGLYP